MKYRSLGRTGIQVSEVGFGCWAIGGTSYGPTKDEDSLAALEASWEEGVNFYDTADTYGHGHSEELLARFLKEKPRGEIYIASKVGWDFYSGGSKKNFSADYIRFACDKSLDRLKSDYIDIYQLHNPTLEILQRGEALDTLGELKKAGKIRFIGISIHTEGEGLWAIEDGRADTLQLVFNLLDQRMADRVLPAAKDRNTGIIVREPLACGLLTGKFNPDSEFPKTDHRHGWDREQFELELQKVDKLRTILATNRLSMTRAALEYALDFEGVSTLIPGAKTKRQIVENARASNDPQLRIEESFHLRELYQREEIFRKGLFIS